MSRVSQLCRCCHLNGEKSIMLRTLDIFSMIVIVAAAVFSARWQAHYSARGATVTAVATIHRRVIYPVFGYPLLLSLLPAAYTGTVEAGKGAGHNLFGERSGFALFRRERVTSNGNSIPPPPSVVDSFRRILEIKCTLMTTYKAGCSMINRSW